MEQPELTETARLRRLYSGRVAARGVGTGCVTPEAILAVIQRDGGEEERLATLEHVMSCASCHREYEWLKALDEAGGGTEGSGADRGRPSWLRAAPLALAASLVLAAGTALLPSSFHRDPADRLIVATCRELEAPLVTHDRLIMRSRLVERWRLGSGRQDESSRS